MSGSHLQTLLDKWADRSPQPDAGPSLWSGSARASATASEYLAVLEVHGEEFNPGWLDRWGHRLQTGLDRLRRPLKVLRQRAEAVADVAGQNRHLDDAALRAHLHELAYACRVPADPGLESQRAAQAAGLAGVMLAVERIHGFRPHVEQLMGALALLDGQMAEMATGEGKTLTAAMAAIVAAWRGLPCHVVTANDYLATRDAQIAQALFGFCHVSATSVDGEMPPASRAAAYAHDIVYCTAKELLGDYLRDGLALGKQPSRTRFALHAARQDGQQGATGVVQRGMCQLIVDEADSVLIDEAVTPLIISSQRPDDFLDQAAHDAVALAKKLQPELDFKLQSALRHVELTATGRARLEALTRSLPPFWQRQERAQELVQMALYAIQLLVRDQHYVVDGDKIILVDELTGRLADQRTLSLGMQQILEASEGLPISPATEVSARLSFQRFFRRASRLGGMTGTAEEARREFSGVYRLFTLKIPSHKPLARSLWPSCLSQDEAAKFDAMARSALNLLSQGRAVLIGMRSVASSEALHAYIRQLQPELPISLLHAVNHAQESAIVARAGQPGALTIATNMAGRGTDIGLDPSVRAQGGLHVIIGEPNDFGRIDRQLIGRCARQGDPGSVQRFIAFDDDLLKRFLPASLLALWAYQHQVWPALDQACVRALLWLAQGRAERLAYRQRQTILKQDIELERSGF